MKLNYSIIEKRMKQWMFGLYFYFLIITTWSLVLAQIQEIQTPEHDPIMACKLLITRQLGFKYLSQFSFEVIPKCIEGYEAFRVGPGENDTIFLGGSSGIAMASALQWYLKNVVHTQTDWNDHKYTLPLQLPRLNTTVKISRSSPYSYYQNVCTVSYTMWAWSWEKWEKHIDWMALNGINLPLAFTGQEKVWQSTFQSFNISKEGMESFFAGAAFLAWGRMGNIQGAWGGNGPLLQSFIDQQYTLQLKILSRMRTFGMIPAFPAFAGHIPQEFVHLYPSIKYHRAPNWEGFPEKNSFVYQLDPFDPMFQEIGKEFIRQYKLIYNYPTSIYQCDTFNEMNPPSTSLDYLKQASSVVMKSIVSGDPNGVWLMQGWLFISHFWTKDRIRAYLDGVSNDRMIILDLYSEVAPVWSRSDNYFGKKWIYCMLHNFGGKSGMRGDMKTISSDPITSLKASNNTMIGIGLTMEGILQNYVLYDMMLEMGWRNTPINITSWVQDYAHRRYHKYNWNAEQAWIILSKSIYNVGKVWDVSRAIFTLRPQWKLKGKTNIIYNPKQLVEAWLNLLNAEEYLQENEAYQHDLVDVSRQVLSDLAVQKYNEIVAVYQSNQSSSEIICHQGEFFLEILVDLERLLSSNEDFLLGKWIDNAKSWANHNVTQEKYFIYQAKNQVTRWGESNNNNVADYAAKQWSGLIKTYYYPRWSVWIKEMCSSLQEKRPFKDGEINDILEQFELNWQHTTEAYPTKSTGDSIEIAKKLYKKYFSTILQSLILPAMDKTKIKSS